MTLELALLGAFLSLGLAAQRSSAAPAARRHLWTGYFWTLEPAVAFYAFGTVALDRGLALALTAAVLASWLTIALGYGYAHLVARERDERGALTLAAGFPNSGFVGLPLAQLAFGSSGLALMAIYDRLGWLVPQIAISTTIARLHGRAEAARRGARVLLLLANPPLLAAAGAVALRAAGIDAGGAGDRLGETVGLVVGPVGFFLLGLNVPLEPLSHGRDELRRAAGVLLIRFAVGPALLFLAAAALGADVPAAFYLGAAMPCAFHLMVLARVFDLRPRLMRLLVVGSTLPAVAAVAAATVLLR